MTTYEAAPDTADTRTVDIPTWTRGTVLRVWAAAAFPMAILAWVVAPLLAHAFSGPVALPRAVVLSVTAGLIWQFILVLIMVRREQRNLRWPVVKAALWLQAPRNPRGGRVGGLLWLVLVPCLLTFGAEEAIPELSPAAGHDLPTFMQSTGVTQMLSGSWTWFAVITTLVLFNTVLGEELLFRGRLLPRMGAIGRGDWPANGVLFALSPAYAMADPNFADRHLRPDVPVGSLPQRAHRNRRHSAQGVIVLDLSASLLLS